MVPRWQSLQCLLFLAAVGGWAQAPQLPRAQPAAAAQSGTAGERLSGELRTTVWRGRELTYEVIDGWAVHDGDIVLGRAEEMKPAGVVAAPPGGEVPGPGLRRDAMALSRAGLWHGGVIPYEITEDATGDELRAVHLAIAEWNARTVVRLVPRTGQEAYAFFERAGGLCRSEAGSGSGRSTIYTVGCGYSVTVHEIGHSVGLGHEHQRADRDEYVMLLGPSSPSVSVRDDPFEGPWPYDYRSVMHYGDFDSIPPGMPVQQGSREGWLSAGDIDGVNRRYGEPSEATLVTTNPPGLEVVVDGYRVTTPASFHWPTGSSHVLEAPLWQAPQWRYLFGRWGDGGDRVHDFTVDPGSTWIEASFILQAPSANNFTGRRGTIYEDRFEGFDATPRALTFVANPAAGESAPQVIRLTNRGDVSQRYLVGSDRPWLVVSPAEASLAPGESADIEVRTLREGLRPDARRGELTIRPAALDAAEAAQIPGIPVAFVVLPELVPVTLGTSGETVEVAVSATEGLLGADGRPLATGGRVTAGNGDVYALTADSVDGGPTAVRARFVPRMQSLGLADGVEVVLEQRGAGDWRIGADRVRTGHRYVAGEHEYVLELAGTGEAGFSGDGGPATEAQLNGPRGVAVDAAGNVYVAESSLRLRKIDAAGTITTMRALTPSSAVAVDSAGSVYVADGRNDRLRKMDPSGAVTTVAGTGDRGPWLAPAYMTVDGAGNVYVADDKNHLVRRIDPSGTITTLAGTGTRGFSGDGSPATEARLNGPRGVAVDAAGNVYVADLGNHRLRRIDTAGTIATVAGTGEAGFSGDGGPATEARLGFPDAVAVDAAGGVYLTDWFDYRYRLRRIDPSGTIATATAAGFPYLTGVTVDSAGNAYLLLDHSGGSNGLVRKVDAAGTITTLVSFSGYPRSLATDNLGQLYVGGEAYPEGTGRIWKIDTRTGTVEVIAGPATPWFDAVDSVGAIAADSRGNVWFAADGRVRVIERLPFAPQWQDLALPGGTVVRLEHREEGSGWQIGDEPVRTGDRYAYGGSEHVIELLGGHWRVTSVSVPLGSSGESAEVAVLDDGTLSDQGRPLESGSRLTASNFDSYELTIGPGGIAATFVPRSVTTNVDHGAGLLLTQDGDGVWQLGGRPVEDGYFHVQDGWEYVLEWVQGAWQAALTGPRYSLRSVAGSTAVPEGVPAVEASLNRPAGIAVDAVGNVFVADTWNHRIRRIDIAGVIRTVVGSGDGGLSGDGGPATEAQVLAPEGVAVDAAGNVYVLAGNRLRKIDTAGIITRLAGDFRGDGGDGGPAIAAKLNDEGGVAADAAGSVYVADAGNHRVRKVDSSGIITTIAGTGGSGFSGDGGLAAAARLNFPVGVAVDAAGSVYVADTWNHRVRKVDAAGIITTIAGKGLPGDGGDGGPATETRINNPVGVAVDGAGNLFVAETGSNRVRKVDAAGIITTIAGTGEPIDAWAGGPSDQARFLFPSAIALDGAGNLFFVDAMRIWKLDSSGIITVLAGTGESGFGGDGGPAIEARLRSLGGVAVDAAGNVYVVDTGNRRLRKIDTAGTITTVAGTGESGFDGDRGPAIEARLRPLGGVAVDAAGNVYVVDTGNHRLRKIDTAGTITTVAGTGESGFDGDGGPATEARLSTPTEVAADAAGSVYVVDQGRGVVRKIDPATGNISTVFTGVLISSVAVDDTGNMYVGVEGGIGRLDPDSSLWVIAGTGRKSFNGDGDRAAEAELSVSGIAVDRFGSVWFTDPVNRRVRVLDPAR